MPVGESNNKENYQSVYNYRTFANLWSKQNEIGCIIYMLSLFKSLRYTMIEESIERKEIRAKLSIQWSFCTLD